MIDFTNLIEALQGKKKQTGAEGRPPLTGGEMPILNIPEQAMPPQASYAGSFPHQPGIMTNPPPTMREQGGLPPSSLPPPVAPPEGTRYGTPLPPEDEVRYGIPVMAGGAQTQEMPPPIQPGNNYPVLESVPRSRQLQDKLDSLDKDYSKAVYRNPETGETSGKPKDGYVLEKERGKDRDKSWSNWEKAGAAVLGYLQGGVAGAVQAGTDRNFFEKMGDQNQRAQLMPQLEQAQKSEQFESQQSTQKAQRDNMIRDDVRSEGEFKQRQEYLKSEASRKIDDRKSREGTSRMTQVAGILKDIPSYDPADPRFAELTKALGDVNLPITPKDAKKKVDLKQDQRTGAWEAVVTDTNGQIETRPVMKKDGTQLKTTPTVVMQGEYGLFRQNDQQEFQKTENEKNRKERRELFMKNFNYKIEQDAKQGSLDIFKRKAELKVDLEAELLTQEDYDEMIQILDKY